MLSKNAVKLINSLDQKKFRQKYNLFVVEGVKNFEELNKSEIFIKNIFHTKDYIPENKGSTIELVTNEELKKISFLKTTQKILAVCEIPQINLPSNISGPILVLDDIRDPGNLGTIVRLADWFGITEIICSHTTVDLFNPKTVQATMGSISRVNLHYVDLQNWLKNYQGKIVGTFMQGENIYKNDWKNEDLAIVLGNEANGISPEIEDLVQQKISIPSFGKVSETESLNVAMAASIIVGEYFSQISR